eukprot:Rmarinus@m.29982
MKNESNRIEVFVRVRPALKGKATFYGADELEKSIEFKVPKDLQRDVINNKKEEYTFKFDSVFDQKTTQETIFDKVAKKACLSSLDGYNATVFAYGQTGSGKTYTVTGGPESYNDRGIIPRTLELVFFRIREEAGGEVYRCNFVHANLQQQRLRSSRRAGGDCAGTGGPPSNFLARRWRWELPSVKPSPPNSNHC